MRYCLFLALCVACAPGAGEVELPREVVRVTNTLSTDEADPDTVVFSARVIGGELDSLYHQLVAHESNGERTIDDSVMVADQFDLTVGYNPADSLFLRFTAWTPTSEKTVSWHPRKPSLSVHYTCHSCHGG
jgi:hypothetical protein